jgi:hypothetical protein
MTIKTTRTLLILAFLFGCKPKNDIASNGQHYQRHQDYNSLKKVVDLLPMDSDTLLVKKILGEPNNMGFEYRYTVDSTGENGCTIGAVLKINNKGKITGKWLDEICE